MAPRLGGLAVGVLGSDGAQDDHLAYEHTKLCTGATGVHAPSQDNSMSPAGQKIDLFGPGAGSDY